MNAWMAGLGAGLQSLGANAMQVLAQEQARREREAERAAELKRREQDRQDTISRQDRLFNQQLNQFAFQNNLTPMEDAQAGVARDTTIGQTLGSLRGAALPGAMGIGLADMGDALRTEASQRLGRGRTTELEFADGTTRKYFQRYEDSSEGKLETAAKREQAKLEAAQGRAIDLEQVKARMKGERAFNTLQRLGAVPKGVTFQDAPDEDWEGLLEQHRAERLQTLRNRGAAAGASASGTMSEFTTEDGRTWNRNSRTGQLTPILLPDGTQAKAPPKGIGAPTEAEAKAAGYAQRMLTAQQTLEGMDSLHVNGRPSRTQAFLQSGGSILPDSWAEGWANSIREPEQQVYNNAVGDFINAFLRRDSGAAISATEWQRYAPMFTDRPDDSPEVKAQKKANRAAAAKLMIQQAGKAWTPETERIATGAATQALAPWAQKGMVSPSQALDARNKR